MRLGFSGSAKYIAARDFLRGSKVVKAGEPVTGTRTTLRTFYRQRKINKAPASSSAAPPPTRTKKSQAKADKTNTTASVTATATGSVTATATEVVTGGDE